MHRLTMTAGKTCRDDQYHGNMTKFREHVWYNLRDLPLMMWRDASVQHFDTLSGDYIWPPRTNSCVPFRDVYLDDQNHLHSWDPALRVCPLYIPLGVQGSAPLVRGSEMFHV